MGFIKGSLFHKNLIKSSLPVSQAHKRARFDSVFSYNACSLPSNLLKRTHSKKNGRKQFKPSEVWPDFKYESSYVSLFPFLIEENSYLILLL